MVRYNFIDLTGRQFGTLTVLSRAIKKKIGSQTRTFWLCQCDCGRTSTVVSSDLRSGNTKSCGCLKHKPAPNFIDLAGRRFGNLTVLSAIKKKIGLQTPTSWLCRCKCGKKATVLGESLRSGRTKSCGCFRNKPPPSFIDLTGRRFGNLTVLSRTIKKGEPWITYWRCQCDCGRTSTVYSGSLRTGSTKSCGCLVGKVSSARKADLTGKRFGKLVVGNYTAGRHGKAGRWQCRCDCGRSTTAATQKLMNNERQNCGKLGCKTNLIDRRFGKLLVLKPRSINGRTHWLCQCECGRKVTVRQAKLFNGTTKSCGCLQREHRRAFGLRYKGAKQGDTEILLPLAAVNSTVAGRKKRGHPVGKTADVIRRDAAMREAWLDNRYVSKADVARAFDVNPSYARMILPKQKA